MRTFTVTIGNSAVACIIEESRAEAAQIIELECFRTDLMVLESDGQPLWDGHASIGLREATAVEAARAQRAARMQLSNGDGPLDQGAVVFLVPVTDPTDEYDLDDDDAFEEWQKNQRDAP